MLGQSRGETDRGASATADAMAAGLGNMPGADSGHGGPAVLVPARAPCATARDGFPIVLAKFWGLRNGDSRLPQWW
jgi:hypothetical protein